MNAILRRNYDKRYKMLCDFGDCLRGTSKGHKLAMRCMIAGDKLRQTNYSGLFPQWKSWSEDFAEAISIVVENVQSENPDPHAIEIVKLLEDIGK